MPKADVKQAQRCESTKRTRVFHFVVDVDEECEFLLRLERQRPRLKVLQGHLLDFGIGHLILLAFRRHSRQLSYVLGS